MPRDALRSQVAFSMVPVWVLERCSSRAVHVYALLMKYANHRDRRAWPKTEVLAKTMGQSLRSVERAIAELRREQALQTSRRHGFNGAVLGLNFLLMQVDPRDSLPATGDGMATVLLPAKGGGKVPVHPATCVAAIPPPVAGYKNEPDPENQIQEHTLRVPSPRLAYKGRRLSVPRFLHEQFADQLGPHGTAIFDLHQWYARLDGQDDGPIVGDVLTFIRKAFAEESKRVFGNRSVGSPFRLPYADWTCPHTPRCLHPTRCDHLQAIAAEKAQASA